MSRAVFLFWPKYRLGYPDNPLLFPKVYNQNKSYDQNIPENCVFSENNIMNSGSKKYNRVFIQV